VKLLEALLPYYQTFLKKRVSLVFGLDLSCLPQLLESLIRNWFGFELIFLLMKFLAFDL
jgi:hypothetical protein